MRFTQAHLSSLSRSHWMTSLPSIVLTAPHSLVSLANMLRVCSVPLSNVANKDVKQHPSQYQPLRNTTCHWALLGQWAINSNSDCSQTPRKVSCIDSAQSLLLTIVKIDPEFTSQELRAVILPETTELCCISNVGKIKLQSDWSLWKQY